MDTPITLEHIQAIVDGAFDRVDERVKGLELRVLDGFKTTHKRIDEQAVEIRGLAKEVKETNGKVRDLRSDVDRSKADIVSLESSIDDVKTRDTERAVEMVGLRGDFLDAVRKFTHRRKSDGPNAPAVVHQRAAIDEDAPLTFATFKKIWPLLLIVFGLGSAAGIALAVRIALSGGGR